jgi:hypothetical protein
VLEKIVVLSLFKKHIIKNIVLTNAAVLLQTKGLWKNTMRKKLFVMGQKEFVKVKVAEKS